ncbi:MerC domain-containing protein [Hyphomonas sp.]|uniref:MerC domain-containing protein n=1 Tax=Hyphomonas sp. TaxID=87 RepID=UPI00345DEC84
MGRPVAAAIDATALSLSGLCVVHCLALPVLAAFLPLLGAWAEAEWVHKVFVVMALPVTGAALVRGMPRRGPALFAGLAISGLALLVTAAFVDAVHSLETPLTLVGACLLAAAHLWRWGQHRKDLARPDA